MSNTATATMMETNTTVENNTGTDIDTSTVQYETVEQLAHKCSVSLDEAKVVLETNNWNVLSATHQLEQEAFKRKQELSEIISSQATATASEHQNAETVSEQDQHTVVNSDTVVVSHEASGKTQKKAQKAGETMKKLGRTIMGLIRQGNRNRFAIHMNGEQRLDMPVTILVLLLLGSFGTCAFLMVLGLFFGCRYTIGNIGTVEV